MQPQRPRVARRISAWLLALASLILIYQVFVPPIVGQADNGDFHRIMYTAGIGYSSDRYRDRYFLYVNTKYTYGNPRSSTGYLTSELLPVEIALAANRVVSKDGLLDIRVLGAIHAAMFLAGLWLLLLATEHLPKWRQAPVGLLLVVVLTDAGYVSFLNSFYSEPACLAFALLTIGAALGIALGRADRLLRWSVAYASLAALLVTAKPQYGVIGLPLALLGYLLVHLRTRDEERPARRKWAAVIPALFLVVVSSLYVVIGTPQWMKRIYLYDQVFGDLLAHSVTPARDLEEMGLSPALAARAGTTAHDSNVSPDDPQLLTEFYPRVRLSTVPKFYLLHPRRFLDLLQRTARSAFTLPLRASFERSSGLPPHYTTRAFSLWRNFKLQRLPHSLTFLSCSLLAGLLVAAVLFRHSPERSGMKRVALIQGFLALTALAIFLAASLGEGEIGIAPHLFGFNLLFDLGLVFLVAFALEGMAQVARYCKDRARSSLGRGSCQG